jgi:hypothetical protein
MNFAPANLKEKRLGGKPSPMVTVAGQYTIWEETVGIYPLSILNYFIMKRKIGVGKKEKEK